MGKTESVFAKGLAGFDVSFAQALVNHVLLQGGDATGVTHAMGCTPQTLQSRRRPRFTAMQLGAGLEAAARCLGEEHAGLHIGLSMRPAHLGALGYAAMTAPNGISAIRLYEELQQLLVTELVVRHETAGGFVHAHLERRGALPRGYVFWSFVLAFRLSFMRGACGRHILPDRVALPCSPPHCQQALRALVGAPIEFHAAAYGECFHVSPLRQPNPHCSLEIHWVMAAMARREWREACEPEDDEIARLKHVIMQALQQGANPTLEAMAAKLTRMAHRPEPITARQLQRQLAARQLSFRSVVSELRRERALAQLRSTNLPLADIAVEAGYAELSSFHRAVRRWTGFTPMRIRKEGEHRQAKVC